MGFAGAVTLGPLGAVPLSVVVLGAIAAMLDLIAWAAFRIDKARSRARPPRRRIRERTLLWLAAGGGLGALLGMYGHRQRHKTAKPIFVAVAVLAALVQVAGLGWLAVTTWR